MQPGVRASCVRRRSLPRTIENVAKAYGVGAETLRKWPNKYCSEHGGAEEELTVWERARLRDLQRENKELQPETAPLK